MTNPSRKQPGMFSSCASGLLIFLITGFIVVFGITSLINAVTKSLNFSALQERLFEEPPVEYTTTTADPTYRTVELGGLYSDLSYDDRTYSIYKVIAIDNREVHLVKYRNIFEQIPERLNSSMLNVDESHIPMSSEDFLDIGMELISVERVSSNELEAYNETFESTN